ncbi:MAG: hypothetical protein V4561_02210 [Bacteroidota bacterium]
MKHYYINAAYLSQWGVFNDVFFEALFVSDIKEVLTNLQMPNIDEILDNEAVLVEMIKLISLLETCTNEEQLMALIARRNKIR